MNTINVNIGRYFMLAPAAAVLVSLVAAQAALAQQAGGG